MREAGLARRGGGHLVNSTFGGRRGHRDRPGADLDALATTLVALGRLAVDLPEVAELDLNPLLCDADGVIAVDARIAIGPA